ncbi:MAG TPA: hypothetical protein DCZ69_19005 [Syntrophobacteraceae bacterium]|nr:hypothetical protein [Syntrophobacteraceae bacterium]HBD10343.1 hypothetical protein [Syntrophobacteraceae bacterium]
MRSSLWAGLVWLVLLMMAGCAPFRDSTKARLHVQGSARSLEVGDIVAMRTGDIVGFDALVSDLAAQQVIYLGETHSNPVDHDIQLRILTALRDRGGNLLVGMEMFPRSVQPWLGQWSTGELKEEAFLEATGWERNWGFPVALYRPILEYCRDRHIRILGLNAPPEVVRRIAQYGLDRLDPAERLQVAKDFDRSNVKHREAILAQYRQHMAMHGTKGDFDSFYDAQLAWEETMAETLAAEFASHPAPDLVLVLIGNGHIEYRYGVPLRTERRFPHSFKTVIPVPLNANEGVLDRDMADYVWITPPREPFPGHRGRLGVRVKPLESGRGLLIEDVLPDAPAAKAGIAAGDVLVAIDGQPVASIQDIHTAVVGSGSTGKGSHRLLLQRQGAEVELEVVLPRVE